MFYGTEGILPFKKENWNHHIYSLYEVFPRAGQGNIRAIFGSHLKLTEFNNFNRQRIEALKINIFDDNHFGCLAKDLKPANNILL